MVKIECICPLKADGEPRHPAGDTVMLRERLDFRAAVTARNALVMLKTEDPDASVADVLAMLTETYLLVGIESWSLIDAKGKALEVSRANIRAILLTRPDVAMVVGDAADELYSATVLLPLLARAGNSSPTTPTDVPTSPTSTTSPRPRKHSRPSSTTTSRTDDIVPISASPAGDSSSSPSSG